jgi:Metallo-peptidase family M12B Reprolysin-like
VAIYLEEDDDGLLAKLSISTTGQTLSTHFRVNGVEYDVERSSSNKVYFLAPQDPKKQPSFHGGGEPPASPDAIERGRAKPDVKLEKKEIRTKAVSTIVLRVGVVQTNLAATQTGNANNLKDKLDIGFVKLASALGRSSIPVQFSLIGNQETVTYSEMGKPLKTVLEEANGSAGPLVDIASFRQRNEVDILLLIVGSGIARNKPDEDGIGGYAYIRGDASKSVIVLTADKLETLKIAHEIGHLLGADHHRLHRNAGIFDNGAGYGHVTPFKDDYPQAGFLRATIMVETDVVCMPKLGYPCIQETVFSDSTVTARVSLVNYNPLGAMAALCSLQNPFSALGDPCPTGSCKSPNNCPYSISGGRYCARGSYGPFSETDNNPYQDLTGANCYPASIAVFPFQFNQPFGIVGKADVASLWRSGRPAELAGFRNALGPILSESIGRIVAPVATGMLL